MKTTTSFALLLAVGRICLAQDGFNATLTNKKSAITVLLASSLEPAAPKLPNHYKMGVSDKKGFSRYAANQDTREYFGYDIAVQPVAQQPGYYSVTFSDLSLTATDLSLPDPANWSKLPAPAFPPPQIMKGSEAIAVDVFMNPVTRQKIIDYIRIKKSICDAQDEQSQRLCLSVAKLALMARLQLLEQTRDAQTTAAIEQSQVTWEKYKNEACSGLSSPSKRFHCELDLVRSRNDDLGKIY